MRQEVTRMHKGWALDSVTLANDVTKHNYEDVTNGPAEGKLNFPFLLNFSKLSKGRSFVQTVFLILQF
jgi:hypothetical protein